jgi:hypothetical protein
MLDLESTSFVISPEAAKALPILVIIILNPIKLGDVTGNSLNTNGLFTVPLGLYFSNHQSYNNEDHAFEVLKTSQDYDALIQAWYCEKHKAPGTTTSNLDFPHCSAHCYNPGKIHPEYLITYDK